MRFDKLEIQICSHTFLEATPDNNDNTDKSHNSNHTDDDNGRVHFAVSASLSLDHRGCLELRGVSWWVRASDGVSIVSVFCDLLIQLWCCLRDGSSRWCCGWALSDCCCSCCWCRCCWSGCAYLVRDLLWPETPETWKVGSYHNFLTPNGHLNVPLFLSLILLLVYRFHQLFAGPTKVRFLQKWLKVDKPLEQNSQALTR